MYVLPGPTQSPHPGSTGIHAPRMPGHAQLVAAATCPTPMTCPLFLRNLRESEWGGPAPAGLAHSRCHHTLTACVPGASQVSVYTKHTHTSCLEITFAGPCISARGAAPSSPSCVTPLTDNTESPGGVPARSPGVGRRQRRMCRLAQPSSPCIEQSIEQEEAPEPLLQDLRIQRHRCGRASGRVASGA